ncbi:MAG TPA: GntR family transcriptional regulator [Candidatus Limnocylindrales bacterium]|nr:GntR family transcriptional regulator [Candidatus Limnocylindrales bacterium]
MKAHPLPDPAPTPPLRVATKAEAVYDELRTRILDGTLEPGSVLNQEVLAAGLGLSITPLREALRRLEVEGLVRLKAHSTMAIAPLTLKELTELYAVRTTLDPVAAGLAAAQATDAQLKEIARLAAERPDRSPRGRLLANRRFHRAVYSACGNLVLTQLLDQLWDRTDRYRLIVVRERTYGAVAMRDHREIAAALLRRDAIAVSTLVRQHVETTRHMIERLTNVF